MCSILRMKRLLFSLFICITMLSRGVLGQPGAYSLRLGTDLALVSYSLVTGSVGLLCQEKIAPLTVDEINSLDPSHVNSVDRYATAQYSNRIAKASDYMAVGFMLSGIASVGAISLAQSPSCPDFWRNSAIYGAMYMETMAVTYTTNLLVKTLVHRTRPFVYNDEASMADKMERDARFSYFSMHTSFTAASSFFAASIISQTYGKSWQSYVGWGMAAAMPIVIGGMRIESGRHFPTDVRTGYAFGALCGLVVPWLHKHQPMENTVVMPMSVVVKL